MTAFITCFVVFCALFKCVHCVHACISVCSYTLLLFTFCNLHCVAVSALSFVDMPQNHKITAVTKRPPQVVVAGSVAVRKKCSKLMSPHKFAF